MKNAVRYTRSYFVNLKDVTSLQELCGDYLKDFYDSIINAYRNFTSADVCRNSSSHEMISEDESLILMTVNRSFGATCLLNDKNGTDASIFIVPNENNGKDLFIDISVICREIEFDNEGKVKIDQFAIYPLIDRLDKNDACELYSQRIIG